MLRKIKESFEILKFSDENMGNLLSLKNTNDYLRGDKWNSKAKNR